jgi:periplasmic protein TonB
LVFENRNKEYGAYQIRKKYNSALLWSILVSVFFVSASVITPFVIEIGKPIVVENKKDNINVIFETTEIPIDVPNPESSKPESLIVQPPKYLVPQVVEILPDSENNKFGTIEDYKETVKNDSVIEVSHEINIEIDPEIDDNKVKELFDISEKPFFGVEGDNEFRGWIT